MNSCWRLIRPRSPLGSVCQRPLLSLYSRCRAGEGQPLLPVQGLTAQLVLVEAGVLVAYRPVEVHRHAAHCVDDALEAPEVDLDVVVDVDPEVGLQGVDQGLRSAPGVRGVDPLLGPAGHDRDPQVPREREEVDGLGHRVDPGDHDGVAPLTGLIGACFVEEGARVAVGALDHVTAVGPDDEEVDGLIPDRLGEGQIGLLDLAVAVPAVGGHAPHAQQDHHESDPGTEGQPLAPRPSGGGGAETGSDGVGDCGHDWSIVTAAVSTPCHPGVRFITPTPLAAAGEPRRQVATLGSLGRPEHPLADDVALDLAGAAPDGLGPAEEERRLQRVGAGSASLVRTPAVAGHRLLAPADHRAGSGPPSPGCPWPAPCTCWWYSLQNILLVAPRAATPASLLPRQHRGQASAGR